MANKFSFVSAEDLILIKLMLASIIWSTHYLRTDVYFCNR